MSTPPQYPLWEYCELRQEIAQGVMYSQFILFYGVDGTTREEKFGNRESAIARLGLEGWEMVSVVGSFSEGSSGFRVFFKRPIDRLNSDGS
jgi:hypothetical protein